MHPNLVLSYPMQWSHFDLIFHLLQGFHHSSIPQEQDSTDRCNKRRSKDQLDEEHQLCIMYIYIYT